MRADSDGCSWRCVARGVFHDIGDGGLEEHRISFDQLWPDAVLDAPATETWAEPVERRADQVIQLKCVDFGMQSACFDAAQIEQVADEPVQVLDLAFYGVDALAPRLIVRGGLRAESAGRGTDRRQRRAQVV